MPSFYEGLKCGSGALFTLEFSSEGGGPGRVRFLSCLRPQSPVPGEPLITASCSKVIVESISYVIFYNSLFSQNIWSGLFSKCISANLNSYDNESFNVISTRMTIINLWHNLLFLIKQQETKSELRRWDVSQ